VLAVSGLSDLFDGMIARKFDQITVLGQMLDPLADKLMVISVMLSLVIKGAVPVVILVILLLKEVLMIIGGALMLHYKVVVYAKSIGKVAQFVVVVGLILCFFRARFAAPIHLYVLWVGIGLTLIALVFYAFNCLAAIRRQRTPNYPNQEV
jgi:cardiolipin synthase